MKNSDNYTSDPVLLAASGSSAPLSEKVVQELIGSLKSYSPRAVGDAMLNIIVSTDPLVQGRLILGQLTRISQEASKR